MALAKRAAWDKEGNSNSSKSNGDKGGRQAMVTRVMARATVTMWVMAMAMKQAGDEEGKGKGGKVDCNGNEGDG
jgi:hypothetical protein